jgi:hypothetical protein
MLVALPFKLRLTWPFETDTALATYLFTVIDRAVITETSAFRQLNPHFRGVRLVARCLAFGIL